MGLTHANGRPGSFCFGQWPFPVLRPPGVDTNVDRVKTFLAAHSGQFYCHGCLAIEVVPGLSKLYVNQLTRRLRNVKPYRSGQVVCFRCGKVRQCIAYGPRRADDPFQRPPKNGNPS